MDDYLLWGQTSHEAHQPLHSCRGLRAHPNIAAIRMEIYNRIDWLHGGVRQERHLIDGVDAALVMTENFVGIPLRFREVGSSLLTGILQRTGNLFRAELRIASTPLRIELRHALQGCPGVFAEDCNS